MAEVPYVQGAVIMVIALLILRLGGITAWAAMLVLVDANLDPGLQEEIIRHINEIYGVRGVGEVRIRRAGPFQMVECTIATKPILPLYEAHQLAEQAEASILRHHPHVESVFVHVEPAREQTLRAIIPVESLEGLGSRVFGHFGRSRFFAVVRYRLDLVFTEQIGVIAFSLLKSNFVDVYGCPRGLTVAEVVTSYHRGELVPITAPTHSVDQPGEQGG